MPLLKDPKAEWERPSITTWGISDQYTWIRWAYPRRDGTANRPLPLDWSFNEKPMMAVINEFRNRGA